MVGEDNDVPCFQHVSEMFYGLVNSQQLSFIGAIILLRRVHIL